MQKRLPPLIRARGGLLGPYRVTDRVSVQCPQPRSPSTFQCLWPFGNGLWRQEKQHKMLPFRMCCLSGLPHDPYYAPLQEQFPTPTPPWILASLILESALHPSPCTSLSLFCLPAPSGSPLPPGPSSSSKGSRHNQMVLCRHFAGSRAPLLSDAFTQVRLLPLLLLRLYVEFRSSFDFLHPGSPWKGRDRTVPNRTQASGLYKFSF